ncbi:SOS response-associated peptidase family protein [Luteolibacter yonseiensis]|uniref:Abasic site processing protein n=1 Tax=Luteolibacter yonseiensis TaxID=1144680 RepID=A0A934VDE9_9BACT|nr:SOS response-associated peptidase family protein [Luteolibacter yonseiensis]MBK1817494.1 SOS response-associated peptidase family protein [Luteolibacter yonseiensis]
MCTAYELGSKKRGSSPGYLDARAVQRLLEISETRIIRPTHIAPVIMPDGSLREMRWGIPTQVRSARPGAKPLIKNVVNSRENKLKGWPWRDAFQKRRCLIPASAFYEWVELDGKKIPLRFVRPDLDTIWIAGIWEDGQHGECYSMITTDPNEVMEPVHDRMPAVLQESQIPPYLAGELHEFGPSAVGLAFTEAENFLKGRKEPPPPPAQGDLFS